MTSVAIFCSNILLRTSWLTVVCSISFVLSAGGQVRIQAIHDSPYAEAAVVDVYVAGQRAFNDFAFRTASAFSTTIIPPGSSLIVQVTDGDAENNSSPFFTKQINFPSGSTIIVAAGDPLNRPGNKPFDLYTVTGLEQSQTPGNTSALFFHGTPDAESVDVVDRLAGTTWVNDLAYGNFAASYVDVPAKTYALGVSPAADNDTSLLARYLAFNASLADAAAVVLASGFVDSEPSFEFMVVLPDGGVSFLPEVIDVASARSAADTLANFAVEGVVTRAKGRLTYVQQDTAGIAVFQSTGSIRDAVDAGDIAEGDSLVVSGDRSDFGSLQEIAPADYVVLSRGNSLPVAQEVSLAQVAAAGESYESELIRITDITIDPAGDTVFRTSTTYDITDPSDASGLVSLRVPGSGDTGLEGVTIPAVATFQGVLGQFSSSDPASGYQLTPVNASDIEVQSGVGTEDASEVPASFALLGAYPNPFNPTTTISYELPQRATVTLQVFDLLGKVVRVVDSGSHPAGRYSVTLDAQGLSSGLYLYRLEAGDFRATKSVLLVK